MTTLKVTSAQETRFDIIYGTSTMRVCKVPRTNVYVLREKGCNDVCIDGKQNFLQLLKAMAIKDGLTIDPHLKHDNGNCLFLEVSYITKDKNFCLDGKFYNDQAFTDLLQQRIGLF